MSASANITPAASPYKILIVDDEEIVLVSLRETLARQGYRVLTAPNPIPALEILKNEPVSVIISDQAMPEMTGLEFLAQAKQVQPDATRILITALLSLDTVIDAINKGEIYRFIVKPWLREELLTTVKNAVQRYELICRNAVLQATTLAMNDKLKQLNKSLEEQVNRVAEQNNLLAGLNDALSNNLQRSVELCLKTMETFYPTLGSQARRVHEICRAISDTLQLSSEQRQNLEIASWLYDIGLVGTPRKLIRKWQAGDEPLSDPERVLIYQHPILGAELAGFADHLKEVGSAIRSHHERFDGGGFPDGLAGENIPWLGRMLAVAVAYAEMDPTMTDPVKAIKLQSGSAFDPEAVRAFLRALPQASVPRRQREVMLQELNPGMILAKGIYTANGMLLIPEGQVLNETFIDKLLNHNRINPISQSLIVYC